MKIIYTKRKTIAIVINNSGEVEVRAPRFASKKQILKFVEEKQDWINEKCSQVKKPEELSLVPGAALMFPETPDSKEKFIKWAKREAKKVILRRVEFYTQENNILPDGYKFSSVKMSGAKTRWGSCSGKNSLNFSWKLALCPEYVLDYVVVHELCHILHKNHGKHFWAMVNEKAPYYKDAKKWLKENRNLLSLEIYS